MKRSLFLVATIAMVMATASCSEDGEHAGPRRSRSTPTPAAGTASAAPHSSPSASASASASPGSNATDISLEGEWRSEDYDPFMAFRIRKDGDVTTLGMPGGSNALEGFCGGTIKDGSPSRLTLECWSLQTRHPSGGDPNATLPPDAAHKGVVIAGRDSGSNITSCKGADRIFIKWNVGIETLCRTKSAPSGS